MPEQLQIFFWSARALAVLALDARRDPRTPGAAGGAREASNLWRFHLSVFKRAPAVLVARGGAVHT
jgi:hypothetical protein